MKKKLSIMLMITFAMTAAQADVYIVHDNDSTGAGAAWEAYLTANFTTASLGDIFKAPYEENPAVIPAGIGDTVIFLRETSSGDYDKSLEQVVYWNNLEANILMMSPWTTRKERSGWSSSNTVASNADMTGNETVVLAATDSLFAGVDTSGGTVDLYTQLVPGADIGFDTQTSSSLVSGTALATTAGGGLLLARIPQGAAWSTTVGTDTNGVHGADRIYFDAAEDIDGGSLDNFTVDGLTVLNNSLTEFGLVAIPEPATLGMIATFGGGLIFIRRRLMM